MKKQPQLTIVTNTAPTQTVLFETGGLIIGAEALHQLRRSGENPLDILERYVRGDWADANDDEIQNNYDAIACGGRIFAEYRTRAGYRLFVTTEPDRCATSIVRPEEFI